MKRRSWCTVLPASGAVRSANDRLQEFDRMRVSTSASVRRRCADLVDEPRFAVRGLVPRVHAVEHFVRLMDHVHRRLGDGVEIRVGDDHCDLEDAVAVGNEARHLHVYPDQRGLVLCHSIVRRPGLCHNRPHVSAFRLLRTFRRIRARRPRLARMAVHAGNAPRAAPPRGRCRPISRALHPARGAPPALPTTRSTSSAWARRNARHRRACCSSRSRWAAGSAIIDAHEPNSALGHGMAARDGRRCSGVLLVITALRTSVRRVAHLRGGGAPRIQPHHAETVRASTS